MNQLIFIIIIAAVFYVIFKKAAKEPILPTKKNANSLEHSSGETKTALKKLFEKEEEHGPLDELNTAPFQELFPELVGIESHMLRHTNNRFTMIAEVIPVNYFLRDSSEQQAIDINYETWLSQTTEVRTYLQNRFVDLKDAIDEIKHNITKDEELNEFARAYGEALIRELEHWQTSQPRYDLKGYLLFDCQVSIKDIKTDNLTKEQIDQKIIDKAFNECKRQFFSTRAQLRKAEMGVQLLTNDGITELAYYTFNRRKAQINRYRDIEDKEQAAVYVTADTTPEKVSAVKKNIKSQSNKDNIEEINSPGKVGA